MGKKLEIIYSHIERKRLKDAIDCVNELAAVQHNWAVSEKISELATNYRYMLHYLIEGKKDPEHRRIYNKLIRDIYTVAEDAAEYLLLQNSSTLFFDKQRLLNLRTPLSIDEYIDLITKQIDTLSFWTFLKRVQKSKAV